MITLKLLKSKFLSIGINPEDIDIKSAQKSYGHMSKMAKRHIKQNWKALARLGKEGYNELSKDKK